LILSKDIAEICLILENVIVFVETAHLTHKRKRQWHCEFIENKRIPSKYNFL